MEKSFTPHNEIQCESTCFVKEGRSPHTAVVVLGGSALCKKLAKVVK